MLCSTLVWLNKWIIHVLFASAIYKCVRHKKAKADTINYISVIGLLMAFGLGIGTDLCIFMDLADFSYDVVISSGLQAIPGGNYKPYHQETTGYSV